MNDGAQKLGAKVYLPELKYCGDNGAMIAAQGYYEFKDGNIADLTLNGLPTPLPLTIAKRFLLKSGFARSILHFAPVPHIAKPCRLL